MLMSGAQLHALIGEGEQNKNFLEIAKMSGNIECVIEILVARELFV